MKYRTKAYKHEKTWSCFYCFAQYPNTLLFCPKCNIAKKHSDNLHLSAKKKKNRLKKNQTYRQKKRRNR